MKKVSGICSKFNEMKIVFNTLAFLIFLLGLSSCKKDKDSIPPTITFSSPAENKSYKVFDTISIKAVVDDNIKLEGITIKLLNASLAPVQDNIFIDPSGKSVSIDKLYLGL